MLWALRILVAVLLLQTLSFKFTAHPQSVYIFSKIGLEPYGRISIGVLELIASVLILIPLTSHLGSLLSLGLMSGAIFMHLTKLGIYVDGDANLFYTSLIVFLASLLLTFFYRSNLIHFFKALFLKRTFTLK